MSGLRQFFHRFMPAALQTTGASGLDQQDGMEEHRFGYDQSLTASAAVAPGHVVASDDHQEESESGDEQNDNDDHPNANNNINNSEEMLEDDEMPEYTDGVLDYKEWKLRRNDILKQFLSKRIFLRDDDEDDDESDEDELDDEEEGEGESPGEDQAEGPDSQGMGLESQEICPETQDADSNTHPATAAAAVEAERKKRRKHIPHVDETVHDVSILDDIDLYAQEATISLAQVTKVFGLRSPKRFAATNAYCPRYQPILRGNGASSASAMPRLLNAPLECDGPLSTVYKDSVLNLEISQLHVEPLNPARRQTDVSIESGTTTAASPSTSRRKMRIFFYDQYANCLDECLKGYDPKKHVLLLAFEKIPAVSIFPYAYHNWYEQQEMSEFCFCLGGASGMTAEVNGEIVRPRFDSEDLRIVVAMGDRSTGEFHEYSFQKSTQPDDILEEHAPTLSVLFRAWQERWNMPILGQVIGSPQQPSQNSTGARASTAAREETATTSEGQTAAGQSQQPATTTTPRLRSAPEPPAGLPHSKRPRPLPQYQYVQMVGRFQILF